MNQQVNLYRDEFKPQRLLMSFNQLVGGWLIAAAVCAAYSWYLSDDLQKQRALLGKAQSVEKALNQNISELEEVLRLQAVDAGLQQQSDQLRSMLGRGAELLNAINENKNDSDNPVSIASVFEGLAQQNLHGVSLNEIHISQGPELVIHGKARSAEQVPRYLKQLGNINVFKGMRFEDLQLDFPGGVSSTDFRVASKREASPGEVALR